MSDIHYGFRDASEVPADDLFRFLDTADSLESIQDCRRKMLERCPPIEGQRILDAGCGIGHIGIRLARLVGPSGRVVGIDKNPAAIAEARRRSAGQDLPLEFHEGDLCQLPLEDGQFDVCRSERVLMFLPDTGPALDEMLRVLRPGGTIVLFEFDYEGPLVDAPDRALTRRVSRLVGDSVQSPWIGRQLPRLLRQRGVQAIVTVPHFINVPHAMFLRVVSGPLERAVQSGQLTAEEQAAWLQSLAEMNEAGHFFAGYYGFIVSGRK